VSAEEVGARLASGRRFSALLADGRVAGVDRDLLAAARHHGCAVLVVDDPRVPRDWVSIGASAVLEPGFGRDDLRLALAEHATTVDDTAATSGARPRPTPSGWRGPLVAVVGAGGSGSTTVAMALAQALADDARHGGRVVLADLCLDADLALLHDAREVVPGLPELVEAHRLGEPSVADVEGLTFGLRDRGYRLLLGLRRHRDWTVLRPRAVRAAIEGLRRSFHVVVVDTDADLEGESQCGSIDVEERNLLARTAVADAEAVVVVGTPGLKGTHTLVRLLHDVVERGVDPGRVVTVVNRAPRAPHARAEITRSIAELTSTLPARTVLASPIYLPDRRRLDDVLRDARRLPAILADPIRGAVDATLARHAPTSSPPEPEPVPIEVGSLGSWSDPP
jgi:CO dehydrogenase nickel-insertion accessory protein CooC1